METTPQLRPQVKQDRDISPISVAEFEFALALINAAAENRMQVVNPETVSF
jgi:hypothetical protein